MLKTSTEDFHKYVDAEKGLVDRSIYSDADIYQLELERIFARAWNFMCHESQISRAGDFFLTYIGDDSVIVVRDKTGALQVLLNSCRHRGNAVCRAEQGRAKSFMCTYHGWTYGLDGKLIGVPGHKDFYSECLDKAQWGLIPAAKVSSYKGFVFATMDPTAPALDDFLGPVGRLCIDQIVTRGQNMTVVDGVQKFKIGCNWKLAVDNVFDYYHSLAHLSASMSGGPYTLQRTAVSDTQLPKEHRVILGEYGHAIGGPKISAEYLEALKENPSDPVALDRDIYPRIDPGVQAVLGEAGLAAIGHPHVFPNLWITQTQVCLRLPRGPSETEIWWFTLQDSQWAEDRKEFRRQRANHYFGPAGMLEQEDGENWDQSTRATRGVISKRYPLNFSMNVKRGEVQRDGAGIPFVDCAINEHAQLWTYRAWADWMSADSWEALARNHTRVPQDVV